MWNCRLNVKILLLLIPIGTVIVLLLALRAPSRSSADVAQIENGFAKISAVDNFASAIANCQISRRNLIFAFNSSTPNSTNATNEYADAVRNLDAAQASATNNFAELKRKIGGDESAFANLASAFAEFSAQTEALKKFLHEQNARDFSQSLTQSDRAYDDAIVELIRLSSALRESEAFAADETGAQVDQMWKSLHSLHIAEKNAALALNREVVSEFNRAAQSAKTLAENLGEGRKLPRELRLLATNFSQRFFTASNFGGEIVAKIASTESTENNPVASAALLLRSREFINSESTIAESLAQIRDEIGNSAKADAWQNGEQNIHANRRQIIVALIGFAVIAIATVWISRSVYRAITVAVNKLTDTAAQINHTTETISSAGQMLAEGSHSQSQSIVNAATALAEITAMTQKNVDHSQATHDTTRRAEQLINQGAQAVDGMVEAMSAISDSAKKIGNIIKTIDGIAFQTNLLALNAAVEAARAGEAGKGFAVVAEEVRSLAQRSATAASNTTELIDGTVQRVKRGVEIAGQLGGNFKAIETESRQLSDLIEQIISATKEQSGEVEHAEKTVSEVEEQTRQNAISAEESADAALDLSEHAELLETAIAELAEFVGR